MEYADLHVHSNYSDGSDSPKELIEKIKQAKINIFALTDHDTTEGCMEIKDYIPEDIKFIPRVELTCKSHGISCHVLGYNCNPYNETLLELIKKGKVLRRQKLDTRINFLKEVWGIELTKEEKDWLYSRKSVVKTHVANVLVNRGLAKDNLSAMAKYLDNCKTGNTKFTIDEAINAIKASGGISVWAHPIGGEGEEHISKEELLLKLKTMIDLGIEGLECYYSRYNFEEISFIKKLAEENNLFITGGSDYHGSNKDIPLGKLNTENKMVLCKNLTILKNFE